MRDQGFNEKGERSVGYDDTELQTMARQISTGSSQSSSKSSSSSRVSDSTLDSVEEEIKI